jgi:hypothetical protein
MTAVVVHLPPEALRGESGGPAGVEQWQASVAGLVGSLTSRLAPYTAPTVEIAAGADAFALTIDERPAVVGRSGSAAPDGVLDDLASRLIRRPGLLIGQPGRTTSVQAYLADLGRDPSRPQIDDRPGAAVHELAEEAIDRTEPDEIVVEAPAAVLRRRASEDDLELVSRLRRQNLFDTGLVFPDVRLRPTPASAERGVRVRLNDLEVPVYGLHPTAGWQDVVDALTRTLRPQRHWFLRQSDVRSSLSELGYLMPDLVQSCLEC